MEVLDVFCKWLHNAYRYIFVTITVGSIEHIFCRIFDVFIHFRILAVVLQSDMEGIFAAGKYIVDIFYQIRVGSIDIHAVLIHNSWWSATENTCIRNDTDVRGVQTNHFLQEFLCFRNTETESAVDLDTEGDTVFFSCFQTWLKDPCRNHGNEADNLESEAMRHNDFFFDQIDTLTFGQRTIAV